MTPILTKVVIYIGFYTSMLNSVNLDVPLIYEYPDYSTACESVAMIEISKYNEFDIGINEFLNNYLDTINYNGSSIANFENVFDRYFVGNFYSSHGFLCNPLVEVNVVKKYFSKINKSKCSCHDLTETYFENLLDYVSHDRLVVI